MADRWALIVGIGTYLDPALDPVPYAESGATAIATALVAAGYPTANQIFLIGNHATRTVLDSRLRKLRRSVKHGDTLLVYYTGRGLVEKNQASLACWDTQADDVRATSLTVADLRTALRKMSVEHSVFLCDAPGTDPRETETDETITELYACDIGGESPGAAGLKSSVWTYLVAEALAGRTPRAREAGRLTAASLQKYLAAELPKSLRKHLDDPPKAQPRLFGEPDVLLADPGQSSGFDLNPNRLRRVAFRAEEVGKVKALSGFRKPFQVPTMVGPAVERFVVKLATADIQADIDATFAMVREHGKYRRNDLTATLGPDGTGRIQTPDFEYTVAVTLDPTDPSRVVWRREVGRFVEAGFVRGPVFATLFGDRLDQLAFEFDTPVDVSALIDRLEDRRVPGATVEPTSDGLACDIRLAGFPGRVTVDCHSLVVRGKTGSANGLLDRFLAFLSSVGPLGETAVVATGH